MSLAVGDQEIMQSYVLGRLRDRLGSTTIETMETRQAFDFHLKVDQEVVGEFFVAQLRYEAATIIRGPGFVLKIDGPLDGIRADLQEALSTT